MLKTSHEVCALFPWPVRESVVSSKLTLTGRGIFFNTPNSHKYGCGGKDIYEFAKMISNSNISVIVRNLHYNIQNAATGVNKVTRP